eukprot:gnl/Dysnectes_brevis/2560_a3082_1155.p1 GENE.gnl/Dysnectes_brevis/2560_a3082_1155~~gnl/Dysnectes_brevis/2560_a3082_1155.p1  ORF type:complete len:197 (-),score=47.40 gnl/Dysnectes_brevis/2560_a3082_1155:185-775(-)
MSTGPAEFITEIAFNLENLEREVDNCTQRFSEIDSQFPETEARLDHILASEMDVEQSQQLLETKQSLSVMLSALDTISESLASITNDVATKHRPAVRSALAATFETHGIDCDEHVDESSPSYPDISRLRLLSEQLLHLGTSAEQIAPEVASRAAEVRGLLAHVGQREGLARSALVEEELERSISKAAARSIAPAAS